MTDLELQNALITEIEGLLERQSLKKPSGEAWRDIIVYRQDKPFKNDEDTEDQEDYIIVMLDDEDVGKDGDGSWEVTVHIIISIMMYEVEHQGNILLANLMNQLDLHFRKQGFIGQRFEMLREAHKRFNHECYPNYYECDYITKWKLPLAQIEGIEDLI